MIRVIMHGCNGKMGRVITGIAADDKNVEIVAGIDAYTEITNTYPVFSDINKCDVDADVIIDFSAAAAVDSLIDYAVERNIPVVLCTTGLSGNQLEKVALASEKIAVLKSANMSLGVNTMMKLLSKATEILSSEGYDIEIVEKHHNLKVDAPSGTALALADTINDAAGGRYEYTYDRSTKHEKRSANEIGISAVRGGTIVGEHEVFFCGIDEVIEIKHTAFSRAVFAKGSITAAKYLAGKGAGMYGMADALEK